jgi:phosphotransacetylase
MAVHLEITTENLLNAVAQMPESEFNRFVEKAKQLRIKRKAKFSGEEADLIHKINTVYSTEKRQRYNELYDKFKQETITPREYKELLKLSDEFEMLNAKRLEYLGELARMRGQTLRDVIKDLGMKP